MFSTIQIHEPLVKHNSGRILLILIILFLLITFAINEIFITDGLYYQSLGEKLAADRIAKMIELSRNWQWLGICTSICYSFNPCQLYCIMYL